MWVVAGVGSFICKSWNKPWVVETLLPDLALALDLGSWSIKSSVGLGPHMHVPSRMGYEGATDEKGREREGIPTVGRGGEKDGRCYGRSINTYVI